VTKAARRALGSAAQPASMVALVGHEIPSSSAELPAISAAHSRPRLLADRFAIYGALWCLELRKIATEPHPAAGRATRGPAASGSHELAPEDCFGTAVESAPGGAGCCGIGKTTVAERARGGRRRPKPRSKRGPPGVGGTSSPAGGGGGELLEGLCREGERVGGAIDTEVRAIPPFRVGGGPGGPGRSRRPPGRGPPDLHPAHRLAGLAADVPHASLQGLLHPAVGHGSV
jgi:hypothetical protein